MNLNCAHYLGNCLYVDGFPFFGSSLAHLELELEISRLNVRGLAEWVLLHDEDASEGGGDANKKEIVDANNLDNGCWVAVAQ